MFRQPLRSGIIHPNSVLIFLPLLLLAAGLLCWWDWNAIDHVFGRFEGQVVSLWEDDGLNMRLEREFAYVDPDGRRWVAPSGSVINGASIPRVFWSVIGGPFEGRFRNASVLHDAACEKQTESWQSVHLMFYNAMRCSRVGLGKAQTMYWAVYHFGPRWREVTTERIVHGQPASTTEIITETPPSPTDEIVAKAQRYFDKKEFTPEEIQDCTVQDIETEVAKWDAAKK